MTKKLTLRLDNKLIKRIKKIARIKGISLSRIVEDYFRFIMAREINEALGFPVLYEISGIISPSAETKKPRLEYRKHLEKKYHYP